MLSYFRQYGKLLSAVPKPLLCEAGEGNDVDSVWAGVGKFASGDDHQQVWLADAHTLEDEAEGLE